MNKDTVSYEVMIDIISNIVKRYIEKDVQTTKEDDEKCLALELQHI